MLLHFGAVDWKTNVWVNGKQVGNYVGGYTPFTFDITDALTNSGEQEMVISVWDPTDKGFQPAGKQTLSPRGIWYTSTSGIWQTVWLEPVPLISIQDIKMDTDIDRKTVSVSVDGNKSLSGFRIDATVYEKGKKVATGNGIPGKELILNLNETRLWSPDTPFLYDRQFLSNGNKVDEVKAGMRK